jgi:putative endonuclease
MTKPLHRKTALSGQYYVYILTNPGQTVLYTGVTNDLKRRVHEHRMQRGTSFTSKYKTTKLVYFKAFNEAEEAIKREKQIKAGSRQKKINLINSQNPQWLDLYDDL